MDIDLFNFAPTVLYHLLSNLLPDNNAFTNLCVVTIVVIVAVTRFVYSSILLHIVVEGFVAKRTAGRGRQFPHVEL